MGLFSPFLRLRSNEKTFFRAGSQRHRSLFASRTSDQAAVAIPKCHCARTNPPLVQFRQHLEWADIQLIRSRGRELS
jgi:hypothetical protein